jgi:hypothetical protein
LIIVLPVFPSSPRFLMRASTIPKHDGCTGTEVLL